MNLKLLAPPNDGEGGGGVNMATGLPFAPNVQQYSPERSTSTVQATPGYMQGIARGQQAYADQIGGMQAEQQAAAKAAQGEVNIRQGYDPDAFEREDPFEAKRRIGQAARDREYWEERQRIRAQQEQTIKAAHQRFDERFQAATQAADPKSFWDDMNQYQRSNARLMVIMGAMGANKAHPNAGIEYLQSRAKEDAERKAQRADRLIRLAETSKGALSDAYRQRAEELSDFDLNYAAGMKILADQAALYAKTMLPQTLQAQAQQKVAAVQQEAAKAYQDAHEKLNARVENKDAHSTTTTSLGSANPNRETVTHQIATRRQAEQLGELQGIIKRNPEAWKEFQEANKAEMEGQIADQTAVGGIRKALQAGDLAPITLDQRLKSKDARRINQIWPIIQTSMARVLDPIGVLNESSHIEAKKRTNLITMPPEEANGLIEHFKGQLAETSEALESPRMQAQAAARAAQKQSAKPAAQPAAKAPPELVERAKAALKANPNNAKAKRVLELAGVSP